MHTATLQECDKLRAPAGVCILLLSFENIFSVEKIKKYVFIGGVSKQFLLLPASLKYKQRKSNQRLLNQRFKQIAAFEEDV